MAPEGATYEYMARYADEISNFVEQTVPEQEKVIQFIGGGQTNRASMQLLSLIHI